jgi:hypothetical protein
MTEAPFKMQLSLTAKDIERLASLGKRMAKAPADVVVTLIREAQERANVVKPEDAGAVILRTILRRGLVTKRDIQRAAPRGYRNDGAALDRVLERLILNGYVRADRIEGTSRYRYRTTEHALSQYEAALKDSGTEGE